MKKKSEKNCLKKLVILFILISVSFHFYGQIVRDDRFLSDFVIRNWTSSDGLPGNSITDLVQSSDAYMYIGCYDGLVRFDGNEFIVNNHNSNSKYSFISVRSLFEDSDGNLWIGSNDEGICCIDKAGNSTTYTIQNGLPNNSIRAICEDLNKNIWIGTASGICCIKDKEVISLPGWETIPSENKLIIKQLYCDSAGRVWIITNDSAGTFVYSDRKFNEYKGLKSYSPDRITYVTQDSSKSFWFGITPGFAVKIEDGEETVYDLQYSQQLSAGIACIFQDSRENMWFATDRGIVVLHGNKISFMNQINGLSDEKVTKIMEDRDGNIWLATDRGGVEKLSQTKFKTTTMTTSVNAIAEDTFRNVIWLAADDGLYCLKKDEFVENEITELCKHERIRHVDVTKNGDLLISTYVRKGQLKIGLDGSIKQWTKENGGLTGNKCRVALETKNGDLYIGTTSGLSIVDGKTGDVSFMTTSSGIPNDYVMCLYEADNGDIWVGTDGGGIYILRDRKIIQVYDSENGLCGNVIFKISSFMPGEIWICNGTGVNRFKDGKFFTFNYANGLGIDSVFQMIPDYTMKVWGTSNRGIFSVPYDDLIQVAEGKKDKVNSKYFGYSDGIISSGVTSTSLSMKDESGQIWFTLADGIAVYNPVKNSEHSVAPVIHIQNIVVDNKKISDFNQPVKIMPDEKRVSIKYTGISFVTSEQVQFSYKLEGFDKEYSEWTPNREVSYTNLKPGTYSFVLKARNSDDNQSVLSAPLVFIKKPAVWQTIWFWILIVIFAGTGAYFILHHKFSKIRKERDRVRKMSLEITKALAGTIDAKDTYTRGHSSRVAKYSVMIAEKLGKSEQYRDNLYICAMLHDIGKIGIPDSIINKPSKLTNEEYAVIKSHPRIGGEILSSIKSLPDMGTGARWHHERWDGKGYPDNLKGIQIPEIARIIAVADAYDAMSSNRSYRKYLSQNVIREEILKCSGTQFDPKIAAKMLELIDEDTEYKMHE